MRPAMEFEHVRRLVREQAEEPRAVSVEVSDKALTAALLDGRAISVPLLWHPRLAHATPDERGNWEITDRGAHIRWPDVDVDLSVKGLLAGWPSGESDWSFRCWLDARQAERSAALVAEMAR